MALKEFGGVGVHVHLGILCFFWMAIKIVLIMFSHETKIIKAF